jgi:Mrp family chromosome partitioning ATPase
MSKLLAALRQIDVNPAALVEQPESVESSRSEPAAPEHADGARVAASDRLKTSHTESIAESIETETGEGALRTVAELNHLLEEALAAQQIDLANEIFEPLELDAPDELLPPAPEFYDHLEAIAISRDFVEMADQMLAALNTPLPAVVMIATAESGSADSFWLLPLAIACAKSHVGRVLIVEADGDAPNWPAHLGIEAESGMVDALKDFAAWRDSIRRTAVPRIDLLPRGTGVWPTGVEADEQLESLLVGAKTEYQLILVAAGNADRPAAAALAAHCDGVLLVVDLRRTARSAAHRAKRSLESIGARVIGAVVRN